MKPKPLAFALVAVVALIGGIALLLIPEDDSVAPSGVRAAQGGGPEGLPEFRADLGEGRPAEPLVAATPEAGLEPGREAAGRESRSDRRKLSGRLVRASDGSGLPGAVILLGVSTSFAEPVSAATTGQDGKFELEVATTLNQLDFHLGDAWPQRSQSYPIEPGPDDVADIELVFDSGFSISGLVLDEAGRRLAGSTVDVSGVVEGRGDEEGHFVFNDIAPAAGVASVRVSARAPGHQRAGVDALVPRDARQPVTVELRLPLGGAIAGRVTDSRGAPLDGVQACVAFVMTSNHGEEAPGGLAAQSDAQGEYLIDYVPEGRYVVEVGYGAGLARPGATWQGKLPVPELTVSDHGEPVGAQIAKQLVSLKGLGLRWFPDVVVVAGQTTRLDVELLPPCAVSGRVLDETGAPVVDAHMTLERIERWPAPDLANSTIITSSDSLVITSSGAENGQGQTELAEVEGKLATDASGHFEFTGLMEGEKRLSVAAAGLTKQSRALDLLPAEVRTGEDFVLERGLTVRGRVRDATGAPIAEAHVEVGALGEETISGGELQTDAEGRFEIGGLPAGPMRLIVFKSGFSSLNTHVAAGGPELELTMKAAPKVIGIVTHAVHGSPITNFDVTIAYEGSSWTKTGGSYPEGRFEMPIDDDTPCTVTVRSGGFREFVREHVLPSRTALDPLQVRLQPE